MGALFTLSLLVFSSLFTSVPNNTEIKDEIIYSLMIDRFYDGDLKNNVPEYAYQGNTIYDKWNRDMLVKMYDKDKETWNKYWGGDLKGLYEKLDYLKELGITTVMITPIFQNANGYLTVEGTETRVTSYHGYWLKDFYRIDEHFISYDEKAKDSLYVQGEKLFKAIVDRSHQLGLKIILDVNLNHTSPAYRGQDYVANVTEYDLQDGAIFEDGKFIAARSGYFEKIFGIKNTQANWFHKYPSIVWDTKQRNSLREVYKKMGYDLVGDEPNAFEKENFMLHNLADLNQNNKNVFKYVLGAMSKWTRTGVDGFRIDAVRHIPQDFFIKIKKRLTSINPKLFFIGEWFESGVNNKESLKFASKSGALLFDFEKMKQIRDLYIKEDIDYSGLKKILERSGNFINFIENQDIPRVLSVKHFDNELYEEMIKLLFVLEGVPSLYYGTEQYLHNDSYKNNRTSFGQIGGDPWNRDYMDWDISGYKEKPIYLMIKKLAKLRQDSNCLRDGATRLIPTDNSILAFERVLGNEKFLYLSSRTETSITTMTSFPDGIYYDKITEVKYEIKGHQLQTQLMPFKAIILSTN